MRFMWQYLKRQHKYVFISVIGTLGKVLVMMGLPTLLGVMIDTALIPGDFDRALTIGWWMFGLAFVGFVGRVISTYGSAHATAKMTEDIRNEVYGRMVQFSHDEYKEFGVPSLTTRISTDAFVLMQFAEQLLRMGLMAPLMIIASIVLMFSVSPNLSIILVPSLFLMSGIIYFLAKFSHPISEKQQKNLDRINGIFRENINGTRVIRSFTQEESRFVRFNQVNDAYKNNSLKLFRTLGLADPAFTFIIVSMIVVIVILGSRQIELGNMQVGVLTAFIEYSFHALFSLLIMAQLFIMYPRATVSANRLEEIMKVMSSIDENEDGVVETPIKGEVEFQNVYFQYSDADEPVLKNISFKAQKGQTVAFIGSTGSGKSTVVQLIPRLYDVTSGRILVDGVDVRDYNLKALREKVGYTPQKSLLFSGTIADNLRFGKEAAEEADFDHATSISQAYDFIQRLENTYGSKLVEGGTNFSGGQRQRLAIARTVIDQPEIYIFDDSFSALDFKTDAKVRGLLSKETTESLTFIVAQRVSSIINADQIIVLDEGEIAAMGTHKELLETSELYQEIARSQLSEEELYG
ncbi:ABC transporter ATP-binding protein [Atopococcus tabaci]|uniref:ABC transporter ATP-binding protein n=1 Tax=Atopococcus tabaci TaxID=269774 RepID=UPI0024098AFB|nr:ABC transporter ATP-binding protein [Atopococcus tabaci]